MKRSPELEAICNDMSKFVPDWDDVIDRYKSHEEKARLKSLENKKDKRKYDKQLNNGLNITGYHKVFSEIILDLSVEYAVQNNSELDVNLEPLAEGKCGDYNIEIDPAGRTIVKKGTFIYEYDKIIVVNKLPVVMEVKLTKYCTGHKRTRKRRGRTVEEITSGVSNYLRVEEYSKRLKPMQDIFGHDVGFVMVVCKDVHDELNRDYVNSIHGKFLQNDGIINPFYTNKGQFRFETFDALKEHNLKLKIFTEPQLERR